jgi:predicted NBD/HSP70 family sugar kinase
VTSEGHADPAPTLASCVVGAVDLGGSHVAASHVALFGDDRTPERVGAFERRNLLRGSTSTATLDAIAATMIAVDGAAGRPATAWVLGVPGPFDYDLDGVDVRSELADRLGIAAPDQLRFLNDAAAAGLGEWWAGAGRGTRRFLYLTLGTGFGSAFVEDGAVVDDDPRVPTGGLLGEVVLRGEIADEWLSTRGIARRWSGTPADAETIAARAGLGDRSAVDLFGAFGADLAEVLQPWLASFQPGAVAVGGGLAGAYDLFAPALSGGLAGVETPIVPARLPAVAPLIGAAAWWSDAAATRSSPA